MQRLTTLIGHTDPLPASLTDPENHGMFDYCQPVAKEHETIVLQEPGRAIRAFRSTPPDYGTGTCYRSFRFAVVRTSTLRMFAVRVRHGGGEEEFRVDSAFVDILMPLESDARFLLLFQVFNAAREARRRAQDSVSSSYQRAFLQGRLKKGAARGPKSLQVIIEPVNPLHVQVVVTMLGKEPRGNDFRRETFGYLGDVVRRISIAGTPNGDLTEVGSITLELKFDDGKSKRPWILGVTQIDPDVWASATSSGLKDALMAAFINEVSSDGYTGEAFRNPILALDALKAKVAA